MTELREKLNNIVEEKNTKVTPENLRAGAEAFGVQGTFTADADATAKDIASGKTAYVNGEKLTGTLEAKIPDCDVKIDLASYATGTSIKDTAGNSSGFVDLLKKVDFSNTDLSKVTSMANMFNSCFKLTEAIGIKADNITNMSQLFNYCELLEKVEISNTDNLIDARYMFGSCKKLISVTPFNTSEVQNFAYMFSGCNVLESISLDLSSANTITNILQNCKALTDIKKFNNLGKAYTEATTNKVQYKLDISTCTSLTHDSLMVVINGLYDLNLAYNVAGGGTLYTQQLVLGSTNLAKLTSNEISIATNKGWTVS